MPHDPNFPIPAPDEPDPRSPSGARSFGNAAKEQDQLAKRVAFIEKHADWVMRYLLRPILFVFIVWLNVWWDRHVIAMVWQSGRVGTGFHLPDGVVIALVTTSVATFVALVTVVAKHLFPEPKKLDPSK